uniref:IS200/IS605 family transposase n=1 Tax=Candidatus Electronema sp. TaxID=2698783 RepID=UPI004055BEF5
MPQSLAKIYIHLVFSTKERLPFLADDKVRSQTHAYLSGACRQLGAPSILVGGVEDHVHILCCMSRTLTVADLVQEIKRASSKWLKQQDEKLACFYWQNGYGVFSVSPSHVDDVKKYIARQAEHHRAASFQAEFRRILKKYGVDYDERYVWD